MHDLKTPLQLICSCAQMVRMELKDREPIARRYVDMLMQNAQEMQRMLINVIDCERLECGMARLAPLEADLAGRLRETCERFRDMAAEGGVRLSFECGEGRIRARFDEEKVRRILMNLLSNALRFTPKGGEIRVCAAERDGVARVTVTDTGCGIPEEMLERVFEKGVTDGGTGYGLYIARAFAEMHGGTLIACRAAEGGASFLLELPTGLPQGLAAGA